MALMLIDLDGTLVDPAPGIVGSYRYALQAMGRAPPPGDDLLWVIGPPLRQTFATLLAQGDDTEEAVGHYRQRYAQQGLFEASVYPDVVRALQDLRAEGHRLLVCTAKPTVFADRVVDHFELRTWFDRVYGADLEGRFDDKGDLIAHILERERRADEAVCMIGDRRHDVAAAARHGIATVGVLWGYGGEAELRDAGAFSLCAHPRDLAAETARALAAV